MEATMHDEPPMIAHPSNAAAVDTWDGNEGAFWATQAEWFDETLRHVHAHFLASAAIGESDHVLDVGCGNGQSTRDAARQAADGSALGVDLSAQMLAMARSIAAAEGIRNVEFRQADAQIYPFEGDRFDAVISRMGSMFFGDPVAAFANLRGALRPDGRLTLLTWQGLDDNEFFTAMRAAVAVGRELPKPPPDAPSPFAFAEPGRVHSILDAAGFVDISVEALNEPMSLGPDPDAALGFVSDFTRPMRQGLDPDANEAALDGLRSMISAHADDAGVNFGSATWIVQARR
jgi:SAM-dependent methyltransferase